MFGIPASGLTRSVVTLLVIVALLSTNRPVQAAYCPFCSAVGQTISEKMDTADVVVMAVLKNQPKQDLLADSDELPRGKFEITQVLRGDKYVEVGDRFETLLVGRYDLETPFMVIGVDAPTVAWSTPMRMSDDSVKYVNQLMKLPKSGGDRLRFFQEYLQAEDEMLAFDAFDEFARAPYADLIEMKDHMKHDKLIEWIKDPEVPVNRKRLYYTMLGVCATEKDVPFLEEILKSGDRKRQRGLDALIACYLNIKRKDGLALIDEQFLKNKDAEYVDVFAVISALRFHGSEVDFVKREDLVNSMRLVLDRPKMADMVIPDLARWEDWTVIDKLVEMFKKPPEESSSFIRVPIVTYLLACPKPEAKKHIEALRKVDANSVLRAEKMLQWEMGLDDFDDDDDKSDDDKSDDDKSDDDKKADDKKADDKKADDKKADDKKADDKKADDKQGKGKQAGGQGDVNASLTGATNAATQQPNESPGRSASRQAGNDSRGFSDRIESPGSASTLAFAEKPCDEFEPRGTIESTAGDDSKSLGSVPPAEKSETGDETSSPAVTADEVIVVPVSVEKSSESFVSTPVNPDNDSNSNSGKAVESIPENPVAAQTTWQGTLAMVMVPMTICILLFLLSWSVINGWFERLIY